jgi:hypothetical protein
VAGRRDLHEVRPSLEDTGALSDVIDLAAAHAGDAYDALLSLPEGDWTALLRSTVDGVLAQVERTAA